MKNSYLLFSWVFGCLLFFSASAHAQFTVTGQVTDAMTSEPLVGVNVVNQATRGGVVTDIEGNFRITLEGSSAELLFSYVGYGSQTVSVSPNTPTLNIQLEEDLAKLEEVVVSGLASTVKRSNLANSVETVSAEELMGNTNPQTLDNALYGKVAGVNMNANSGAPGGGISMQFRGISTLGAGSSQPLFIVDGVYVDNSTIRSGRSQVSGATGGQSASNQDDASNRIADLNPEDIENIEILKGPSAAAIYGTRANAGVVIITTKRGKEGETKVRLSQDIGVAQAQNLVGFDTWNEDKIVAYFGEGDRGQLELDRFRTAQQAGKIYDWEEVLYGEDALLSNTQLSLSGGNAKTQFYASAGVQREDGIIKNTGFDRYSARLNLNHELFTGFDLNLNTTYTRSSTDRGFTGNQNNTGGSLGYTIAYTPTYADLFPDEQGNYPNNPYFNDNPLAIRDLGENNLTVDRFITAAGAKVDLIKTDNSLLKLSVNGGVDYLSGNSLVYFPEFLQHQQASPNPGDVMWGRQDNLNTNLQAFLNYSTFVNDLSLSTQVGAVRLHQDNQYLLERGRGLVGGQKNMAWATVTNVQAQETSEVTDLGLVAQQEINWDDRLIATLGVRFDKSTLNFQQDEFYAFPKASLAANLQNFDLWDESGPLNYVKLRVAYGETGGLPRFGNTFESLTPQLIGGNLGGMVSTRGIDPDLVPETAAELEFGTDIGLLDNRVTLEATYYIKTVRDLILDQQLAESTGITAIATNAADLENKGIELNLGLTPVRSEVLNWSVNAIYWKNESEITELNIPLQTIGGFGPSLGTYLLAKGFSPTTIVGTPTSTDNPSGFTIYGDRQPNFNLSFASSLSFLRHFDFNFLLHHKNGGENINLSALLWDDGGTTPDWSGDSDQDGTPNGLDRLLSWAADGNTGVYIQEASYWKLREIGLYYKVPAASLDTFAGGSLSGLKLGVSANNILISTPYESYDPETSNFGGQAVFSNIEVTPYPSSRRLFFHLNIEI